MYIYTHTILEIIKVAVHIIRRDLDYSINSVVTTELTYGRKSHRISTS